MNNEIKLVDIAKTIIREAKTAWSGRFENLNMILSQNYNNLKSADQNLKDALFRAYYRYFNDGDVIAFPAGALRKINAPEDAVKLLSDSGLRSMIKMVNRSGGSSFSKPTSMQKYEKAMEDAIASTFKYFKGKYPQFFNTEGRQKTIQKWKEEILQYAKNREDGLATYWVVEFGKQFGIPKLAAYKDRQYKENLHLITDPDEVDSIITTMMKAVQSKK